MTSEPYKIATVGISRVHFKICASIPTLSAYDNLLLALRNKKQRRCLMHFFPQKSKATQTLK